MPVESATLTNTAPSRPSAVAAQRLAIIATCAAAVVTAGCVAPALASEHAESIGASVRERVQMEGAHERFVQFAAVRLGCACLAYLLASVAVALAGDRRLRRWAAVHAGVACLGLMAAAPLLIQG